MAKNRESEAPKVPRGKDFASLSVAINEHLKAQVSAVGTTSMAAATGNQYIHKYPTNILSLDRYLGTGGILGGRILDIHGWEGTGKTLTTLTMGAAVQKMAFEKCDLNPDGMGRVAFLDAEGTFSPSMAASVGIDPERIMLFRSTPERILTGEDYFAVMSILIQNGIEMIIVDSTPSLIPASRLNAVVGQGQKATQAQMMAEGLQQITTLLNAFQRTVVVFINQMRMKPMVMFGPTEGHTGGTALNFFATYSLEVDKLGDIQRVIPNNIGGKEERRIGVSIKAKLVKNKTAAIPVDPITWDVYFHAAKDIDGLEYVPGVDIYKDVVEVGIQTGVIQKSSSWFYYGDIKSNGKEGLVTALRGGGPELLNKIRTEVLSK